MKITVLIACILAGAVISAQQTQTPPAQPPPSPTGYQDTPMQPNGKWHIHDGTRPQPRVVTPGPLVSLAPPSDAVVLAANVPRKYARNGPRACTASHQISLRTGNGRLLSPMIRR